MSLQDFLYGATHSEQMIRDHSGRGFLVLDQEIWTRALVQIRAQSLPFRLLREIYLFTAGHKKAATLAALAREIGLPAAGLAETVRAHNDGIRTGAGDPGHKAADLCVPIERSPCHAIDISIKNVPAGVRVTADPPAFRLRACSCCSVTDRRRCAVDHCGSSLRFPSRGLA